MISIRTLIIKYGLLLLPAALLPCLVLLSSCRKEKEVVYHVNEEPVYPPNTIKDKLKTEEQYISILYANLFQKALSANKVVDATDVIESIGDKNLAHEMIVSSFMNDPTVVIPSDSVMRADVDRFVDMTYRRFLIRRPTEIEKTWFRNFINSNPKVTPELVYVAFALCNEYYFY